MSLDDKSLLDKRVYSIINLPSGSRAVACSDPTSTFAAACVQVNVGYTNDPKCRAGLAHFLEHTVHLGSGKYPDPKEYKAFLAEHGGTSNASTGEHRSALFSSDYIIANRK